MARKTSTKPKKALEESLEKTYKVSIEVNGNKWETSANSIDEALSQFTPPVVIKSETVFTITKGSVTRQKILNVFLARRTFGNAFALKLLGITLDKSLNG